MIVSAPDCLYLGISLILCPLVVSSFSLRSLGLQSFERASSAWLAACSRADSTTFCLVPLQIVCPRVYRSTAIWAEDASGPPFSSASLRVNLSLEYVWVNNFEAVLETKRARFICNVYSVLSGLVDASLGVRNYLLLVIRFCRSQNSCLLLLRGYLVMEILMFYILWIDSLASIWLKLIIFLIFQWCDFQFFVSANSTFHPESVGHWQI